MSGAGASLVEEGVDVEVAAGLAGISSATVAAATALDALVAVATGGDGFAAGGAAAAMLPTGAAAPALATTVRSGTLFWSALVLGCVKPIVLLRGCELAGPLEATSGLRVGLSFW